jgi:hypothetical protein
MQRIFVNGASQSYANIPAGYALKAVTNASVDLSTSVAASDIIELSGATGAINVNVPMGHVPQVVGTDPPTPTFPPTPNYDDQLTASWIKVFYNNNGGGNDITVRGYNPAVSPRTYGATVVVAAGTRRMLYSPNGVDVYAAAAGV